MKLDDREWKLFFIGDLFSIKRPVARNKDEYEDGRIPFVASGSVNNGVLKCCKPRSNEQLDNGNCITISPVDGSAFYQPFAFLGRGGAGSSVLMLYSEKINLYCGQFIAKCITQTCAEKYTYGHMGNKDSVKRERIMLPVTEAGEPDYQFMEDYVRELMERKRKQYLDYLSTPPPTFCLILIMCKNSSANANGNRLSCLLLEMIEIGKHSLLKKYSAFRRVNVLKRGI